MFKIIKLLSINFLVFLFLLIIGFSILEIIISDSENQGERKGSLIFDRILGWDSFPPIEEIGKKNDSSKKIIFIGDSFTHNVKWTHETIKTLNEKISVEGFSLGASGFSTIQSYIKLKKHFGEIKPDLVVLLFYAWNDMRDNYNQPGIIYSPKTEMRPYLSGNFNFEKDEIFSDLNWFKKLNIYQDIIIKYKLRINKLIVENLGIDFLSKNNVKLNIDYTNKDSWVPFHTKGMEKSKYVESAWNITEVVLKQMNEFIKAKNKKLIIIGIDNAFTIDADVREVWTDDIPNFDIYKNINVLESLCEKNNIPFIDGLSILEREKKKINKKIYNYPAGNLSGHLEPEGELAIANSLIKFINKNKILE
tara:strand:+ start:249 stop:1337 length:1089 start_codon:yes stop_codon:yes gene_type:complete